MSWQAVDYIVKNSRHKGSELLCLIMIANHADGMGRNAFPSIPTLAAECRMSDRQLTRLIAKLEKSGELKVTRKTGEHHYYEIVMEGTPDNMSRANNRKQPVPRCHPRQDVTADILAPVTECHPAPDKLSGDSRQDDPATPDNLSPYPILDPIREQEAPPLHRNGGPPKGCVPDDVLAGAPNRNAATQTTDGRRGRQKITPPSQIQVRAYAKSKGATEKDADAFRAYYASVGWLIQGRMPMVDWKASFDGWMLRSDDFGAPGDHEIAPRQPPPHPATDRRPSIDDARRKSEERDKAEREERVLAERMAVLTAAERAEIEAEARAMVRGVAFHHDFARKKGRELDEMIDDPATTPGKAFARNVREIFLRRYGQDQNWRSSSLSE